MDKLSISLPSMFGDHHVTEVRRILSALPGIGDVYASSSFQIINLDFDPTVTSEENIRAALKQHGYLEDVLAPVEVHKDPSDMNGDQPFFRHTASIQNVKKTISFQQEVPMAQRALWPCPGLKVIPVEEEVDHA